MDIEYFSSGGTATAAGVFIPADNLAGVASGEFAGSDPLVLEGKFVYGFLNPLILAISTAIPLGLTATKSGTGTSILNTYRENCTFVSQWIVDYADNSIYCIPLPTVGSFAGTGGLTLAQVFPECSLKSAGAAVSGEGALFPHTLAVTHGGSIPSGTDVDARDWFQGSIAALCADLTVRSASVASAVGTKTNLSRIRATGASIPESYTAPYPVSNPLSGLDAANLAHLRLIQESLAIEYEFTIDPVTQTLEVRVATA